MFHGALCCILTTLGQKDFDIEIYIRYIERRRSLLRPDYEVREIWTSVQHVQTGNSIPEMFESSTSGTFWKEIVLVHTSLQASWSADLTSNYNCHFCGCVSLVFRSKPKLSSQCTKCRKWHHAHRSSGVCQRRSGSCAPRPPVGFKLSNSSTLLIFDRGCMCTLAVVAFHYSNKEYRHLYSPPHVAISVTFCINFPL